MKKIVSLEYDGIEKKQIFSNHYLVSNNDINILNKINDLFIDNVRSGDRIYYDFSVHGELKKIISTNNIELLKKGIVVKQVRSVNNATLTVFNDFDLERAIDYVKNILSSRHDDSSKICINDLLKDVYFKKINIADIDEYHIINDQRFHKSDLEDICGTILYEFIPENLYDKLDTVQLQPNQVIATGKVFKTVDIESIVFNVQCLLDTFNKYCRDSSTKVIGFSDYINSTEILKQRMTISDYNNIIRLLSNDSSKIIGCEILYSYNHLNDINTFLYTSFIINKFSSLIAKYRESKAPIKELATFYLSHFGGLRNSLISEDLQNLLHGGKDLSTIKYYQLVNKLPFKMYKYLDIKHLIFNSKIDISILDIYFQEFNKDLKEIINKEVAINYQGNDCIKINNPYAKIDFLEIRNLRDYLDLDPERYKALREHYVIPYKMNIDYQDSVDDIDDN